MEDIGHFVLVNGGTKKQRALIEDIAWWFCDKYHQIKTYWIDDHWSGVAKDFLNELLIEMKGKKYFNNDDIQTDYFCRSHYTDINIGK